MMKKLILSLALIGSTLGLGSAAFADTAHGKPDTACQAKARHDRSGEMERGDQPGQRSARNGNHGRADAAQPTARAEVRSQPGRARAMRMKATGQSKRAQRIAARDQRRDSQGDRQSDRQDRR